MPRTTPTSRQRAAYDLRQQGLTYQAIADRLGLSRPQTARQYVMRAATYLALTQVNDRRFGVEIEFVGIGQYDAYLAVQAAGLAVRHTGYTHSVISEWKVVPDGSVRSGGELVSPPLRGEEGFAQVRIALKALRDAGARVSRSCGLHVHHDMNGASADDLIAIVAAYAKHNRAIDEIMPQSRRDGRWAAKWTEHEIDAAKGLVAQHVSPEYVARSAAYGNRYKDVNLTAFAKYGTVEFRQHAGTLNAEKVIGWIRLGQAIIQAASTLADMDAAADIAALADLLRTEGGLSETDAAYLARRARQINA